VGQATRSNRVDAPHAHKSGTSRSSDAARGESYSRAYRIGWMVFVGKRTEADDFGVTGSIYALSADGTDTLSAFRYRTRLRSGAGTGQTQTRSSSDRRRYRNLLRLTPRARCTSDEPQLRISSGRCNPGENLTPSILAWMPNGRLRAFVQTIKGDYHDGI